MAKLEMYRGDYREFTVKVTDAKNVNSKVHFAVKPLSDVDTVDQTDALALFTATATDTEATDNGDGTVSYKVVLDGNLTNGKEPGKYKAEVEYVNGSGRRTTYPHLDFVLKGDINQRS